MGSGNKPNGCVFVELADSGLMMEGNTMGPVSGGAVFSETDAKTFGLCAALRFVSSFSEYLLCHVGFFGGSGSLYVTLTWLVVFSHNEV